MKKIFNISEIFIIVAFAISIYCFSVSISLSYQDYKKAYESNRFNNSLQIGAFNYKEEKAFSDMIEQLIEKKVSNIMTLPMDNIIQNNDIFRVTGVRGIVGNLEKFNIQNMQASININEAFNTNSKIAIIGGNAEKAIIIVNGKEYIKVFNEEYEVVGKIKENTYLEDTVFIPMKSLMFYNHKYSSFKFLFLKDEIGILENNFSLSGLDNIPKLSLIKTIIESDNIKENLLNLSVGVLNLALFSLFYCEKSKRKLAIMKVLGATNKDIFKEISINYSKLSIIAWILGITLSWLTSYFINNSVKNVLWYNILSPVNFTNIVLTTLLLLIITILISIFELLNVITFKIISDIR